MPGIVVGVDGSPDSQLALEWAVKEAALRHSALTALAVHQVAAGHWTGNPLVFPQDAPLREQAMQDAEEAVSKAARQLGDARPESVTVAAVSGLAAKELIDASHGADLMVVGSRGAGGFASLLMGSVSSQVVAHAACPVVVVPTRKHR